MSAPSFYLLYCAVPTRRLTHRARSSSYQLAPPSLLAAGYTAQHAASTLRAAVALARAAAPPPARIALSMGCFGSSLSPGQEYAGLYPPPYGPAAFAPDTAATNCPATPAAAAGYEAALAAYHLARLRVYAADEATWRAVGWLAFETVPVLAEVRAVRRAVGQLYAELAARYPGGEGETWWRKPFWIASAFPGGEHGQRAADGGHVRAAEVVRAMLGELPGAPAADGAGINCTNPAYLPRLAAEYTEAVGGLRLEKRPWLVLYPDGGSVYDVVNKEWSDVGRVAPGEWAAQTVQVARDQDGPGVWAGAIVGGCCKSSFEEVEALRSVVGETTV